MAGTLGTTIWENFSGKKVEEAVQRATQIGELMKYIISQQETR
jgi:hypothetical protein